MDRMSAGWIIHLGRGAAGRNVRTDGGLSERLPENAGGHGGKG